jgi:hypothetical protein
MRSYTYDIQQAKRQRAAEQQHLVQFDDRLARGNRAFGDEDVDLEGDIGQHAQHGCKKAKILNAGAMTQDEAPEPLADAGRLDLPGLRLIGCVSHAGPRKRWRGLCAGCHFH